MTTTAAPAPVLHFIAPDAGRNVQCNCGVEYSLVTNLVRHIEASAEARTLWVTPERERTFRAGQKVTLFVGGEPVRAQILGFPDGLVEFRYEGEDASHVVLGGVFVAGLEAARRPVEQLDRSW